MANTTEVLLDIHKLLKDFSKNSGSAVQSFDSLSTNVGAMQSMQRENEKLSASFKTAAEYQTEFTNSLDMAINTLHGSGEPLSKMFGGIKVTLGIVDKTLGSIASKSLKKLGKALGPIGSKVANIGAGIVGWGKALKAAHGRGGWEATFVAVDGIASGVGKIVSGLGNVVKAVAGSIPLFGKMLASVVALGGAIVSSVVTAFGSALSAAAKFSKFLFMLPITMANRASEMGGQLRQELVEVIGQAVENTKEMFDLASNGGQAFKRLGGIAKGSLLTFQSVNSTMTKLFGYGAAGAAKMVSDITKNISDMGLFADIFAESTTKSGKSIEFITRMTRGMAMGADDLNYVVREAMKNGEHYFETMTRMKLASDAASQEFGVNRKLLSKNFFQLRKDITQFGHLSDIELMRVAARATQLGVEMKDLAGVFNKFGTFEDAANSAALLSQTFGMNIDALQLIRAEDPMEIVEMFRNSMLATGRSFDDLNRHEKSLMATHTGMSVEALKTTMNYRTLGKSYEEIKQIMKDQKPEERQIRAMKDMRSSMSEIQKIMDKKDFFTAFTDGLTKTILYNSKLGKSFISINKQMERFYENGLTLTRGKDGKGGQKAMLEQALAPFAKILDEIKKIFSIDSLNAAKESIITNLGKFIKDITGDFNKSSNSKWSSKVESMFSLEYLVNSNSFFAKLTRASGKIIGYILRAFVALGPGLVKGIGNAFESVLKFIQDPSNTVFDRKNLSDFLGFKNLEQFNEFTDSMVVALKDLKSYLFGGGEKKGQGIFSQIYEQLQKIFSLEKGASLFRSLGKSIGQGLIESVQEGGGLRSLIFGDRPAGGVTQSQAQKEENQMERVVKATLEQGAAQGGLEVANQLADNYTGDEGFLAGTKYVLGEVVDGLGDFTAPLLSLFGRVGGAPAKVVAEAANYKIKNDEARTMLQADPRAVGLTSEQQQEILEKASDDQASSSITNVLASVAGTAAGIAALPLILPALGLGAAGTLVTGAVGLGAGALGGGLFSSIASLFTDDAEESVDRQLEERRKMASVNRSADQTKLDQVAITERPMLTDTQAEQIAAPWREMMEDFKAREEKRETIIKTYVMLDQKQVGASVTRYAQSVQADPSKGTEENFSRQTLSPELSSANS